MKQPLTNEQLTELTVGLNELAHNLWWTWDQEAQDIFQELSPRGWQNLYHNAVAILREVSDYELRVRLQNQEFAERVRDVLRAFKAYMNEADTWGQRHGPALQRNPVAYFSAEFGFHETLPIAAGGLGVLAGDHTKAASDLGLGLVGLSLFYREGYFQQTFDSNNWQTEYYTLLNPKNLPMEPVLNEKGEPVVCHVDIAMNQVAFQAWRVNVGRASVYLLDTNRPENEQHFRDLTLRVYGGDSTTRIMQEILLGIGGVRLLRTLGISPSVFHMNEGHAAFLTLELIREKMAAGKNFPEIMKLGRVNVENQAEPFCMTVLALKLSHAANGVSELHGRVSRHMWHSLYPDTPVEQVPISHITNGIHLLGWMKGPVRRFWRRKLTGDCAEPLAPNLRPPLSDWDTHINSPEFWKKIADPNFISDEELWALRYNLRRELIEFARRRLLLQRQRLAQG